MANDFTIDLSQLPAPVLRGALEFYTSYTWSNKVNAVNLLAAGVRNGVLTLDQIRNASPSFGKLGAILRERSWMPCRPAISNSARWISALAGFTL